jgi:glyoxylase-like metal-dependent hydrolase (beta-lactamase superfamily II)
MDVVELIPDLYFFRMPVGHVYLWRDADALTLIDAGLPGSGPLIAQGIRGLGHDPADVRRLVLTHAHVDHTGAAPEIASWGEVTVLAHAADAPFIRGAATVPPPRLTAREQPIFDRVSTQVPAQPPTPVRVDQELHGGAAIDFGGGAVTIATPGHTSGSIAIHLPGPRVLFTGDTLACDPQSRDPQAPVIPGVFNIDPVAHAAAIRRLATVDAEIACFGHGDPASGGADSAAGRLSSPFHSALATVAAGRRTTFAATRLPRQRREAVRRQAGHAWQQDGPQESRAAADRWLVTLRPRPWSPDRLRLEDQVQ